MFLTRLAPNNSFKPTRIRAAPERTPRAIFAPSRRPAAGRLNTNARRLCQIYDCFKMARTSWRAVPCTACSWDLARSSPTSIQFITGHLRRCTTVSRADGLTLSCRPLSLTCRPLLFALAHYSWQSQRTASTVMPLLAKMAGKSPNNSFKPNLLRKSA